METAFFPFWQKVRGEKHFPAIAVLSGYNEVLGEWIIRDAIKNLPSERTDFNCRRFYLDGDEDGASWEAVLQEASSATFFLQSRKILTLVIREESKLKVNKEDKARIAAYLARPNPYTTLFVYVSLALTRDEFKSLAKTHLATFLKLFAGDQAWLVNLDAIGKTDIQGYVKGTLRERGISITAGAMDKLMELKGDHALGVLLSLPRLEAAAYGSKSLDSEEIESTTTGVAAHSIWDLTGAIEAGDAAAYLRTLRQLFIDGIVPTHIIGTLVSHYHKIYLAKLLLARKFPVGEIGKLVQKSGFILDKFIAQVRQMSDREIATALKLIYRLDTLSKTTGGEDAAQVLLQTFFFQARSLHGGRGRGPAPYRR